LAAVNPPTANPVQYAPRFNQQWQLGKAARGTMHTSLLHSMPRSIGAGTARWPVSMRWQNLLFAHWPIEPKKIRPLLPTGLELDTYDGWAWIGIVPFHLTSHLNWMPFAFEFPEVNVRTYANYQGKTGVWFFSLDASSRLAVIDRHSASRWIRFSSRRTLRTAAIEMQ
jgi:hypothetical protein